jgi:hypothetical protein
LCNASQIACAKLHQTSNPDRNQTHPYIPIFLI